ncbi:MAG: long-chain fatty acid--CoA ligase, partial [candidate division Zixibacteria bacterium]|nr:long-chain fatty acid--CoA ligase [candidate division Zixibacteria bacterium]
REAAAVGMKDPAGDEFVAAAVAVREPVTEEALISYCRGLLAAYKVPRRVVFMAELPKGPTGKTRITSGDIVP